MVLNIVLIYYKVCQVRQDVKKYAFEKIMESITQHQKA